MLDRLYRMSLATLVERIHSFAIRPSTAVPPPPVTREFLISDEYRELMSRCLPCDGSYDLHEAQNDTASYRFRHNIAVDRLGIFRWRGMQRNLEFMLELLDRPDRLIVDLGGAAGPLGFGSQIVDLLSHDRWGQPVRYSSVQAIPGSIDVVFSSHTLEHVPQLEQLLHQLRTKLRTGGLLVLHLPSFYCERWRAGVHRNEAHHHHVWTFALSGTDISLKGIVNLVFIDEVVGRYFQVRKAEYCGDDSIFIVGARQDQ